MTLQPGARLGPYEIVSLLGAGGMGEVYRATDGRLQRDVAVKVLPQSFADDPERLRRFKAEALAAAALSHPNILAVYDIGTHDGTPFVVSELLEGESLRHRLSRGALPASQAIDFGSQVALGLAAAHEKAIVHRDVKPDNLFVTVDGRVKILDFGIAKLAEPQRNPDAAALASTVAVTQPGTILGTVGYMSPEQIRGHPVDRRADIFALGCVLYEMIVGRRAFERGTLADSMAAALQEDAPAIRTTGAPVPSALERIVMRCLEKAPEQRFQSASDLAFALRNADAPAPSSAPPQAERTSPATTHAAIVLADGVRLVGQSSPAVAISRDGTKVAYVGSTGDDRQRLYVVFLDRGDTVVVPESDGAVGPCFSPDGRWVAFAVGGAGSTATPLELRKHSFASGLTQTVCPLPDFEGACWAEDGAIYFVARSFDGMRRVPVDGGRDELVRDTFRIDGTSTPRCIGYPQFTSDRTRAVVIDWDGSALGDTSLLDLSTGELRSLAGWGSAGCILPTGHVLFTKTDGTLLAAPIDMARGRLVRPPTAVAKDVALDVAGGVFAVSDTGTLVYARGQLYRSPFENKRLVRLDANGAVTPLPFAADSLTSGPSLSPDRRRLAVSSRIHGLWICDLARGTRVRLPAGTARLARFPVWTPDGARVVFRGAVVGEVGWKIFTQWVDGRAAPEILHTGDAREKRPRAVTRDGRLLFYEMAGDDTERGLWALAMDGAQPPRRVVAGSVEESVLSPDGQWLAYQSGEFGTMEVFVRRLEAQGIGTQVSIGGGRCPRWSNDGAELRYLSGSEVIAVTIDTSEEPRVGAPRVLFERSGIEGFDVDGPTLIAAERPPGSGDIRRLELVIGWFPELLTLAPLTDGPSGSRAP